MNAKVILLIVGLLIGGAAGWLTAPAPALNVDIGPVSVEVQEGTGEGGSVTATGEDGQIKVQVGQRSWLDDRAMRAIVFAIVGAIIGFGAGLVTDRRKV